MPSHSAIHAREVHPSNSNNCSMLDRCKISQYSQYVWLLWGSNMFGYCGVPMLTGAPVSCESEAAKCELALFSAHKSHCFNNQSTPSYFIKIVKKTTIPVVIDNISAKAAGMVESCLLMPYNGTSCGTRSHGIDQPSPPTGNWELSVHEHIAEPYTLASMSTLMSQRQTCLRKSSKAGIELRHPLVKC